MPSVALVRIPSAGVYVQTDPGADPSEVCPWTDTWTFLLALVTMGVAVLPATAAEPIAEAFPCSSAALTVATCYAFIDSDHGDVEVWEETNDVPGLQRVPWIHEGEGFYPDTQVA